MALLPRALLHDGQILVLAPPCVELLRHTPVLDLLTRRVLFVLFLAAAFDTESWFYLFPLGAFAAAVTNYAYLPATSKPFTFQFSLSSSTLINTTSSFEGAPLVLVCVCLFVYFDSLTPLVCVTTVYLAWFANGFASLTGAVLLLRYVS